MEPETEGRNGTLPNGAQGDDVASSEVVASSLAIGTPSSGLGLLRAPEHIMVPIEDRIDLRIRAVQFLKRVLKGDAPRNGTMQTSAALAVLERVWPRPSGASVALQVNVQVNGGVTAIDRWERRHEDAPHQDA